MEEAVSEAGANHWEDGIPEICPGDPPPSATMCVYKIAITESAAETQSLSTPKYPF